MFEAPSSPYVPRDPRAGTLYPLVQQWWSSFAAAVEASDSKFPDFVRTGDTRNVAADTSVHATEMLMETNIAVTDHDARFLGGRQASCYLIH